MKGENKWLNLQRPTPHGVGGLKSQSEGRAVGAFRPTPHGVGGLKSTDDCNSQARTSGPTPHGVGGLKFFGCLRLRHPCCPTPHGVGGLKSFARAHPTGDPCPTPHGVGGLKLISSGLPPYFSESYPTRGGWIEIILMLWRCRVSLVPPHTGWVD